MSTRDPAAVLQALLGANVQFVVVGDPEADGPLRLVAAAHPTNLDALGRALERFSPTVQVAEPPAPPPGPEPAEPRRIGDPFGAVTVTTSAGDVALLLGGARRSLYAGTLAVATTREIGGVHVRWAAEPEWAAPEAGATGGALGGRLLSLASRLAQLVERRSEHNGAQEHVENHGARGGGHRGSPAPGRGAGDRDDTTPAPEGGEPSGAG